MIFGAIARKAEHLETLFLFLFPPRVMWEIVILIILIRISQKLVVVWQNVIAAMPSIILVLKIGFHGKRSQVGSISNPKLQNWLNCNESCCIWSCYDKTWKWSSIIIELLFNSITNEVQSKVKHQIRRFSHQKPTKLYRRFGWKCGSTQRIDFWRIFTQQAS